MARIWTLNIQRDQTIRFIESLFSIFKANNYAPRSHCIPIQGKRNQLNYMWELEKRHKHIQRQANEVRNDSIIGWIFIFLYMFGLWLCAAFKSDGWLDGWMQSIYICTLLLCHGCLSSTDSDSDANTLHNGFRIGPIPKTLVTSLIN